MANKCRSCDGTGLIWYDIYIGRSSCYRCNGSGKEPSGCCLGVLLILVLGSIASCTFFK